MQISEPVPDINIAVLGAQGVGKTTFVQNAFGLRKPPESQASENKIPLKGEEHIVRLLEVPIDDVDIDEDDNTVTWPETIEDKIMPRIDGVLALYDITDEDSLKDIPEMIRAINKTGIPSVLISCKCDALPEETEVDPTEVEEKARRSLKVVDTLKVSAGTPETHRSGLLSILRAILAAPPSDQIRSSSARRRAQSNAVRPVSPRPPSHTRATSEYTGSIAKDQRHSRHDSSGPGHHTKERLGVPQETNPQDMSSSFFFEESASEASFESTYSSAEVGAQQPSPLAPTVSHLSENGATFEELVDRLLARPTSKADGKFAAIFLALYRKFAAPGRLLEAIVERFDALDRDGSALLLKTASQLRYMGIVEQWVGTYPGDFAFPKTKKRMRTFVGKLSREQIFGAAAKEINAELDSVQEDDDTNWAYSDKDRNVDASSESHWISMSSTASKLIDDPTFQFGSDNFSLSGSILLDDPSAKDIEDDVPRSMSSSTLSSQVIVTAEAAQRQAELLTPIPRIPLSKIQWRMFMELPEDIAARELTRMDWIMFASIRPRDLARDVTLKDDQKALCKNLSHVTRMTDHFNYLAAWVSNYILFRDKPKHRALMLEKFMRVARELRKLNNYNALGAFIAGIKSTAVHRLAATRELINPNIGKDWMKLEILMAPTRSYFAYRLAWENTPSERIPFLPVHRRDLYSGSTGNKTFIGDEKDGKINWRKFEIEGEVIVSMQKALGMPYKELWGPGNKQVRELILDVKLVRDDEVSLSLIVRCDAMANGECRICSIEACSSSLPALQLERRRRQGSGSFSRVERLRAYRIYRR